MIDIDISDQQDDIAFSVESVKRVVLFVLQAEGVRPDEVAVHFVSDQAMIALHETYFGSATPTDCISLPLDRERVAGYQHLGEVWVCPREAQRYVERGSGDVYQELTLYVIHGLLHLLGYDDTSETTRACMERTQLALLQDLTTHHLLITKTKK